MDKPILHFQSEKITMNDHPGQIRQSDKQGQHCVLSFQFSAATVNVQCSFWRKLQCRSPRTGVESFTTCQSTVVADSCCLSQYFVLEYLSICRHPTPRQLPTYPVTSCDICMEGPTRAALPKVPSNVALVLKTYKNWGNLRLTGIMV